MDRYKSVILHAGRENLHDPVLQQLPDEQHAPHTYRPLMACSIPTPYRRHQRMVTGLLVLYRILCTHMQCHLIIQQGSGDRHS